jgi:hypothetical protein
MNVWLGILMPSALIGLACARLVKGLHGAIAAAAIPWLGLLVVLLYYEYFGPYQGGGASMWPIAQLVGGTIAAIVGLGGYFVGNLLLRAFR